MSTRFARPPEQPTIQPSSAVQAQQAQEVLPSQGGADETVDVINRKLQSGTPLTTREAAFLGRYYPAEAQKYAGVQRINQKLSGGTPLSTRETAYMARYYPEQARQYAKALQPKLDMRQVGRVARYEPWKLYGMTEKDYNAGLTKQYTQRTLETARQARMVGSEDFWKGSKWPEFAGKVAPVSVPKGYRLQSVSYMDPAHSMVQVQFAPETVGATGTVKGGYKLSDYVRGLALLGDVGSSKVTAALVGTQIYQMATGQPVAATPDVFDPNVPLLDKIRYMTGVTVTLVGAELLVSAGLTAGQRAIERTPDFLQEKIMPRGSALEKKVADWAYGGIEGGFERTASDELLKGKATVFLEKASAGIKGALPDLAGYMRRRIGPIAQATVDYPTVMEEGAMLTGKQLSQDLPRYVAGQEMFDWTVSPKTSGYGATMPSVIETEIVNAPKLSGGLRVLLTSGLTAEEMLGLEKQYQEVQLQKGNVPEQRLSFTGSKPEAQTGIVLDVGSFEKVPYRMGYTDRLGFEKQFLPPKTPLATLAEQYGPKPQPSGPMENYLLGETPKPPVAEMPGEQGLLTTTKAVPVGMPQSLQRATVESLVGGSTFQEGAVGIPGLVAYAGRAYPGVVRRGRVESVEEQYVSYPKEKLGAPLRLEQGMGLVSLPSNIVRQDAKVGVASGLDLSSVLRTYLGVSESAGLASYTDQETALIQTQRQVQRQIQVQEPRQIQIQQGQMTQVPPMFDSDGMMRKLIGEKPSRTKRVKVGRYERDWLNWTPQQMMKRMVGVGHVERRKKRK